MDKRYQVFVSSTYEDLKVERQKVIQQLLELDHIPVGMEFFPAADDSAWEVMKKVIEECDYYIVIVAGRYGSLSPEGISYTQKEYEYAVEKELPVAAFLHSDPEDIPAGKSEIGAEGREKLEEFRKMCQIRLCKPWASEGELAAAVTVSLVKLIRTNPAVGWVRADQVPDEVTSRDVLRLTQQVDKLKKRLEKYETSPPPGVERLAQGESTYTIEGRVTAEFSERRTMQYESSDVNVGLTWDRMFSVLSPAMLVPMSHDDVKASLTKFIVNRQKNQLAISKGKVHRLSLDDCSIGEILIQFKLLGLVENDESGGEGSPKGPMWKLTPYGVRYMGEVKAIPLPSPPSERA